MEKLGTLIRDARARAKLSQAQLARRATTSQSAIARYEAGTATPSLATLERILAACGDSLELDVSPRPVRGRRLSLLERVRRSRERLLNTAQRHGVRNVRVFGSVARGDETPASDVDFLVELEPGRTLLDLIGFQQDAADILGVEVDVATASLMKERVRSRASREARAV